MRGKGKGGTGKRGEWRDELLGMPLLNSSMEGEGKEGSGKIECGLALNAKEEVRKE